MSVSLPQDLKLGTSSVRRQLGSLLSVSTISLSVAFVVNRELTLLTDNKQRASWKIECEFYFRVSPTDREGCSLQPPLPVGTDIANCFGPMVEKWSVEAQKFV